ncbi:MAG: molecular chaperone TorD family protein [Chloroflexota bacterium]
MASDSNETFLARARAYELFGELLLSGPTESLLPYLNLIPELASAVGNADASSLDNLSAAHYALFGLEVYPYESILLDPKMNMGDAVTEDVIAFYQEIGYTPPTSESPDHIGVQLLALASLCRLELQATIIGDDLQIITAQTNQSTFLELHLLRWLPALSYSVSLQEVDFYPIVIELTLALILDHQEALSSVTTLANKQVFALPQPPNLLEAQDTRLKDIVNYLVTPAMSGVFLSKNDIANLGRAHGLPRGFGSRQQELSNLFHAAIDFDLLPTLLEDINDLVTAWSNYYQTLGQEHKLINSILSEWHQHTLVTSEFLEQITAASFSVLEKN